MKYYTIWEGNKTGVFDNWEQCKESIKGYKGAIYKSFRSLAEAEEAFNSDPLLYIGRTPEETERLKSEDISISFGDPVDNSICTGGFYDQELNYISYWGVNTYTGETVFEKKGIKGGNSLLSRFLPIVHALALLKEGVIAAPVYTRNKQVAYYIKNRWYKKLFIKVETNSEAYTLLRRALSWLSYHEVSDSVLLWDDLHWGDMPGIFYERDKE